MEAEAPFAVLVADPDEIARRTAAAILRHFGHTVVVAEDRDQMFEALRNHAEISAVFAEAELAPSTAALKRLRPNVRMVVTGDLDYTETDAGGYVQKPYTARRLMQAVETVLR